MTNDNRPYRGDVTDVRLVATLKRPGPYNRLWQPFIEVWQPGHLLIAFARQLTGKIDMGDIVCAVSTDGGDSWEEPVMIFDHGVALGPLRVAYANPVLYHPPGQQIVWCFAMRCPLYYRDSEDSQLCAAYSADGGRSWQPVELAVNHHSPLITCAGVVTVTRAEGLCYLLPVHRNTLRHDPHGSQDQFVLESSNLLEWKLAGYIPQPSTGPVFVHEGNLAACDGAGLKVVMRTATYGRDAKALEPPTAYSSVSTDGGRIWSPATPEPELFNTVAKAYFGQDAHGNQVYVYSVGPAWQRRGLAYKIRKPGESWGDECVFFDTGVKNSYPTLLEHAPGRFYAVWDSSDSPDVPRTAIRFGRFDIG